MRVAIVCAVLCGTAAWAQSDLGCNKDTDCKGDRICVSGQCVSPPAAAPAQNYPPPQQNYAPPPQQNYPPPPAYQPPPPPPNYPPPNYPPPPPPQYYPRRYRTEYAPNPVIWGLSGMIGFGGLVDNTSATGAGGWMLDGYGELGGRITPGFGLVGFADTNFGGFNGGYNTWTGTLGGGIHFGQRVGLTLGAGFSLLAANTLNSGEGGGSLIAHLSIPFGWYGFGLHLQTQALFFQDYQLYTIGIGFGWSH